MKRNDLRWTLPGLAALLLMFAPVIRWPDWIIYNATPSMPVGWYVRIASPTARGRLVTVRARDVAPLYAHLRNFDRTGDRFLKHVAAGAGDFICAHGNEFILNGRRYLRASHDHWGRLLPHWDGCRRLLAGEWILMGETSDSFDSRYWGPVHGPLIEGVWRPLGAIHPAN